VSCKPGEACWIRAGEPLVLHWMAVDVPANGVRQALCGDTSVAWRCVDEDGVTAAIECVRCAAAAARHEDQRTDG
jgi:hypothetical protein